MAELLYRLGKFAARRAWVVIIAWTLILGVAVGGFLIGFKGLTSSFDIPGTASGEVIDELTEQLPAFSGASGTIVFTSSDGAELTDEQRQQISTLVDGGKSLDGVADVIDPFATEQERADRLAQIEAGRTQIADGEAQLAAGQAQLDAGAAQLAEAQAQLDAARAQTEAAGLPTDELDAAQLQLDAQRAQLTEQQAALDTSLAELKASSEQLQHGATLITLADGIRTVSADGTTALVNVAFEQPRMELQDETKHAVIDYFSAPIDGVDVSFSTDIAQGVPEILGIGEVIGVALAAVILIVMLGSFLAASFPIVTAIVGVGIGAMGTLAFSGADGIGHTDSRSDARPRSGHRLLAVHH